MIRPCRLGVMVAGLAFALISAISFSVNAIAQSKVVRVIPRSTTPIVDRLTAEDQDVRVEEFAIVDPIQLDDDELIRLRVQSAESIVVARITSAQGELTPDGTWVRTRLRGVVEQAIKGEATPRQFEAYVHGGEALLGKVRVQAGDVPAFRNGEAYLLFVGRANEPDESPMVEWMHQLNRDGKLRSVEVRRGPATAAAFGARRNPFEGESIKDVISTLQKYVQ